MDIRLAGRGDWPSLSLLRWEWRTVEQGESGLSQDAFADAFGAWISEHADSHLAWLAEIDGVPAGMAWLAVVERIPGPERWARVAGHLQSVYVTPRWRGHGLGTALVAAVVDEARARRLDYVSVHPSKRSFPLYQRVGFRSNDGVLELDLRDVPL